MNNNNISDISDIPAISVISTMSKKEMILTIRNLEKKIICVVKVQRLFRLRKFKQELKNIFDTVVELEKIKCEKIKTTTVNYFDNRNTYKNEQLYNLLLKKLLSKKVMKLFDNVLIRYYKYVGVRPNICIPIDSKILLSSWMTVCFPEYVIGITLEEINLTPDEYPCDIYFIAKAITDSFYGLVVQNNVTNENDSELFRKFVKLMNQYSNSFTYFKEKDKHEKINILLGEYASILKNIKFIIEDSNNVTNKKHISDESRPDILKEVKKSLDNTFSLIQTYDKTVKREEIEMYCNLNEIKEAKLDEIYKDLLVRDIESKQLVLFPIIMNQIKNIFDGMNVRNMTFENQMTLDDIFNVELMSRLILTNNFTIKNALAYGVSMRSIIDYLESHFSLENTGDEWNKNFSEVNLEIDENVSKLFSKIIFHIFEKQKEIIGCVQSVQTMVKNGIVY